MLAIELSGVHVGRTIRVSYRFPSWPKTQPNTERQVKLSQLEHRENGRVHINGNQYSAQNKFYCNYDAEVTLIGD